MESLLENDILKASALVNTCGESKLDVSVHFIQHVDVDIGN